MTPSPYQEDDFFQFHVDGYWLGSKVVGDELITDAYGDRYSKMTFLILLNDDFEGGEPCFLVNQDDPEEPVKRGYPTTEMDVRTPAGRVLLFPHGRYPLS